MAEGQGRQAPPARARRAGGIRRALASAALRRRNLSVALGVLLALAYGGYLVSRPLLEQRLRARLERAAASRGFAATIGSLRLTPTFTLELREVLLENRRLQLATRALDLRPRLSPRGLVGRAANASLGALVVILRAGVQVEVAPSQWVIELPSDGLRLWRDAGGGRLDLRLTRARTGSLVDVRAANAGLSGLVRILWHGCPVLDPGRLDGEARVEQQRDLLHAVVRGRARGLSFAALDGLGGSGCREASFGTPTDVQLDTDATIRPGEGSLVADRLLVAAGAVDGVGRLRVEGGWKDPRVDLAFEVPRLDFARLLATAGLDLAADDLGSASFAGHVSGRLFAPSRLVVTQRLDFAPPRRMPRQLTRLAGPFVHHAVAANGRTTSILVSPESPDFVPLAEVPPLFLRALLLAEDANFWGHQGVDLSELPVAMAINFSRGAFVRGASTISQQLAKNLFLSRRKTLARKLEEASLALLLDSALGKRRQLEIYLNVIEWGPGLYGLRPAARRYFGREPQQLTPKQMVFLVSLIPGPIKYQRSFETGAPSPFFERLMTSLLRKLVDVAALSEAEYAAALTEPLGLLVATPVETAGLAADGTVPVGAEAATDATTPSGATSPADAATPPAQAPPAGPATTP